MWQSGRSLSTLLAKRSFVLGAAGMTTALLDRLTLRCHILQTGNDSLGLRASASKPKARTGKSAT